MFHVKGVRDIKRENKRLKMTCPSKISVLAPPSVRNSNVYLELISVFIELFFLLTGGAVFPHSLEIKDSKF